MTPERIAEIRAANADGKLWSTDTVTELLAEVDRLNTALAKAQKDLDWLAALEAAGVDNWDGIDVAHEINGEARQGHEYDVEVFHMEDNPHFGTGWTWCKVIDDDAEDFVPDLPHCADEADARAKAQAWLDEVRATTPTDTRVQRMLLTPIEVIGADEAAGTIGIVVVGWQIDETVTVPLAQFAKETGLDAAGLVSAQWLEAEASCFAADSSELRFQGIKVAPPPVWARRLDTVHLAAAEESK